MTTYAGLYPAEQGVDSHGVLLLISNRDKIEIKTVEGTSVTPSWLPIAQVVDLTSPSLTKTFHDVTPAVPGAWKKVVPGYKDAGNITVGVLFNLALGSHILLLESYKSDAQESFRIVVPSVSDPDSSSGALDARWYWAFEGYVASISTSHSAGGIIIGNVGIRITGDVTTGAVAAKDGDWLDVSTKLTTYSYPI